MKTMYAVIVLLPLLAACGEDAAVAATKKDEESAKTAVLKSLKDPDSAKFGKISIVTIAPASAKGSLKIACLTLNARNSYGGYAGDKQVTVANINDAWNVLDVDDRSHEFCLEAVRRTFKK